jgi:hypothetical protein
LELSGTHQRLAYTDDVTFLDEAMNTTNKAEKL